MVDDIFNFDDVIGYQALKKKQLTPQNVLILQLRLPRTHYCVPICLVLLQTVTDLAVYVCASSPAPYYANS